MSRCYERIFVRRDFECIWNKGNPVIPKYELVCIIMEDHGNLINKYKQGDGERTYEELPFLDEIPKYFKICGVGIYLDGMQCAIYTNYYKQRKREVDLQEKLKDINGGLINLKDYFMFDHRLLFDYIKANVLYGDITIKFSKSYKEIEFDRHIQEYVDVEKLFKEQHKDIILYVEDKDVYNKLIKFLEPYKRGE